LTDTRPHDCTVEIEAGTCGGNAGVVLHEPAAPATGPGADPGMAWGTPVPDTVAGWSIALLREIRWWLKDVEKRRGLQHAGQLLYTARSCLAAIEKHNAKRADDGDK